MRAFLSRIVATLSLRGARLGPILFHDHLGLPLGVHLCPNTLCHRHRIQRKTDALACCARVTPITRLRVLLCLTSRVHREYSFFCVSLTVSESSEDVLCSYSVYVPCHTMLSMFVLPPPLHFRSHLFPCPIYM
ncbi:hypothetical protein F5888DRAFT_511003 [Russula emetica]|nr:hypothetical protein F5888DRAFT_511003 [Russula emetica]